MRDQVTPVSSGDAVPPGGSVVLALHCQTELRELLLVLLRLRVVEHAQALPPPDLQLFVAAAHLLLDECGCPLLAFEEVIFLLPLVPTCGARDRAHLRRVCGRSSVRIVLGNPLLD
eukprot:CAMPEP_0113827542 /NCGR_PEP_ID=MMETSP0328-20130328/4818_1 /TAXON_ID=39455 /ORGANISM="Alexandrium minutum" /LENGTH=115 /DNA_ID=CAMNT_0000795529 /DNA_START=44 /DNA_END=388 /DNA_ORIENTATION=+ /assembly_acc=CAM_ASM_000350